MFGLRLGTIRFCLTETPSHPRRRLAHRQRWPCAVSECLCCEAETGEQASTADCPQHDVEIANLIDKVDHSRPLTGYHERLVKRVDSDRMIIIHEVAQPCISAVPIFDHVHLTSIKNPRIARPFMYGRERFGHHDDSLMRPSQPRETAAKTSIGRSPHGRPREIRRRRRAGSFHTGGKPARRIAPQAENWSAQERSMQRRSEYEQPLRPMQGHVNHVCSLHNLWRKALRSGKRVMIPRHAVWGEEGVLRRRLNIGAGNGI